MLRCKSKQKSLLRGKVFQIHGVGLASRKSASLERGILCIGCAIMNGYFSASHFVQNENIFYLEMIAKNKPQNNPNPDSFPFHLKINIFIKWAYSGKHNLIVKGTKNLLSLKKIKWSTSIQNYWKQCPWSFIGYMIYFSVYFKGKHSEELTGHIYTYRCHIELMGNVPMPGAKEKRFPSTDSWANSIVGFRTFVSGLEASSSLTMLKIGEEPTWEY